MTKLAAIRPELTYFIISVWGVRFGHVPCPLCRDARLHILHLEIVEGEYVAKCVASSLARSKAQAVHVDAWRIDCHASGVIERSLVVREFPNGSAVTYPPCPHLTLPLMGLFVEPCTQAAPEALPVDESEGGESS